MPWITIKSCRGENNSARDCINWGVLAGSSAQILEQKRTKPATILNFTRSDLPCVPFTLQFQADEPASTGKNHAVQSRYAGAE